MRERPMLFNGAMVRAILEGRKTQTRRVAEEFEGKKDLDMILARFPRQKGCPYGESGDRLWVRETWAEADRPDGTPVVAYTAGGCTAVGRDGARGPDVLLRNFAWDDTPHVDRWRPSIHMPRWACRLVLEITDVRIERLQDISDADALAEGIQELNGRYTYNGGLHECRTAGGSFCALWESTGADWDSNPWVWVISFKRLEVSDGK